MILYIETQIYHTRFLYSTGYIIRTLRVRIIPLDGGIMLQLPISEPSLFEHFTVGSSHAYSII